MIARDLGVLRLHRVLVKRDENEIVEILFECETRTLSVRYLGDVDELSLAVIPPDSVISSYEDVSSLAPWANVVGRQFGVRWTMTNSNGYEDGLVLGAAHHDTPLVIMIATGKIDVFVVSRLPDTNIASN